MNEQHHSPAQDDRHIMDKALSWYGWGSPIGLGVMILSLSAAALLLRLALLGLN